MGLVSRLSLANHSDSESFLVVNTLFSQDGCQRGGFWEMVRHVVSPFDLSQTLPVGGGLLVPCSLPGPPVVKQLIQMVTTVPGQGGRFPVSVLPLTGISSWKFLIRKCVRERNFLNPSMSKNILILVFCFACASVLSSMQ